MRGASILDRGKRAVAVTLGLLLGLTFVTLPMDQVQQAWLTIAGIVAFLALNRSRSRRTGLVLVFISILVTSRYLFWRGSETLEFDTLLQTLLGGVLYLAEIFAGLLMALSYLQISYPLERKPVPLPAAPSL